MEYLEKSSLNKKAEIFYDKRSYLSLFNLMFLSLQCRCVVSASLACSEPAAVGHAQRSDVTGRSREVQRQQRRRHTDQSEPDPHPQPRPLHHPHAHFL